MQRFGNKSLIRSQGMLSEQLVGLLKDIKGEGGDKGDKVVGRKRSGVRSSVVLAAAITAYGRININAYKNLPDNSYLGGDTDSAIFKNPLDPKFVGKGLGMMKLEGEVVKGIFADKKLYYMEDGTGKTIIKSRGLGLNTDGTSILNYKDFLEMAAGRRLVKDKTIFEIRGADVFINERKITIGIKQEVLIQIKNQIKDIIESTENGKDPNLNKTKLQIAKDIASLYQGNEAEIKEMKKKIDLAGFVLVDFRDFILIDYKEPVNPGIINTKLQRIESEINQIGWSLTELSNKWPRLALTLTVRKPNYLVKKCGMQIIDICKTNLKLKSGLYNKSRGIRQYSTNSKMGVIKDIQKININNIEQSKVLKPILKSRLLAPINYTDYVIKNINYCENILSQIPDSNLVKQFLNTELEQGIEVTATKGINNPEQIIEAILGFDTVINEIEKRDDKVIVSSTSLNDIVRSELSYGNVSVFNFREKDIFIKSKIYQDSINDLVDSNLLKNTEEIEEFYRFRGEEPVIRIKMVNHISKYIKSKKASGIWDLDYKSCCYIITFNNCLYYYLGSTTDMKKRVKTHFNKIKTIIKGNDKENIWALGLFKYFILSENFWRG